ncbi:DNA repair protein RadC [uncultured Bacteroides sp.]|uniref:RadC family protein n=1 Tax=uncultured Bacteroides sp. TaxID=162156 RepID=UPI00261CBAB5|nr:DNA repair protein RadC [uncultured Bacteroides sp.]
MANKLSINQWAKEDRPRERMMMQGASALSNAELLAILIGSGTAEDSAIELMRKVLEGYRNNLSALGKAGFEELCQYKGIGPAKAVKVLAAMELGKRRTEGEPITRKNIRYSKDIYELFYPVMCDLPVEECWILLLNQSSKVIDRVKISSGGLASTQVDVRCILREAILKRAVSIILCHNHPSGNIAPSRDDDRLTEALHQAADTMNIRMLDHIIITDGAYYSYSDEGRI